MKKIKLIGCLLLILLFTSCINDNFIISSQDGTRNISVITNRKTKIRYIINGKEASKKYFFIGERGITHKYDYVKISLCNMDLISDELIGYWRNNDSWVIYNNRAIVLENKLDTNMYKFYAKLPTKEFDITTIEPILKKDYFRVSLSYFIIESSSGNIIIQ